MSDNSKYKGYGQKKIKVERNGYRNSQWMQKLSI